MNTLNPVDGDLKEKLHQEREICALYIDCAKTYIQLCTGALLLSLAVFHEFLGAAKLSLFKNLPIVITWIFWLLSIFAGVTYQYCVIKYLETIASENNLLYYGRNWPLFIPKYLQNNPFVLYGIMMFCFYTGILIFACIVIIKIL